MGKITRFRDPIDCPVAWQALLETEGKSVDEISTGVRRHLAQCPKCHRFAEKQRLWRARLAPLADRRAPDAARRRLFQTLALCRIGMDRELGGSAPRYSLRGRPLMIALAMVFSLAGAGWWGWSAFGGTPDALDAIAEDHWREAHRASIASEDARAIQQWLGQRLSIPVEVISWRGAELSGARLCFLEGREGAVIHYRIEGQELSYFIMPSDGSAEQRADNARELRHQAERGYRLVAWRRNGLLHVLAGKLSQDLLQRLVSDYFKEQHQNNTARSRTAVTQNNGELSL